MRKIFLRIGSLMAMVAVMLGAFGAHGLEGAITAERLDTFEVGVRYHFYHAVGILVVDALVHFRKTPFLVLAGWLFTIGILFFSGSLYLLAIRDWFSFSINWLGPITPIGGMFFIAGWGLLFLSSFYKPSSKSGASVG